MRGFTNTEEKRNKKKAIYYIVLTLVAVAVIYFVGIPLLGRLTSFVTGFRDKDNKISSSDITPPPSPKFKNFPEFSNQESLTLHGNTEAGAIVKLTFNGKEYESLTDSNGQFSFTITLAGGVNTFSATATDQAGNQSQKTDDFQITLDKKAPDLEITSPGDGSGFFGSTQRQVTIQGKTEPEAEVTINDRIISVDESGNFQYTTTLNEGSNTFSVKSRDKAGNATEKSVAVNFTP